MNQLPDWIRIGSDNRISYYPSGEVGNGPRKQIRGGRTRLEAETKARQLIREVTLGVKLAITPDATWTTLLTAWESDHVGTMKEGTYRRRMSAINAHILPSIGNTRLVATDETTLTSVIDFVVATKCGPDNFDSVMQTLNVVTLWAQSRKFLSHDCFGTESTRSAASRLGRKKCLQPQSSNSENEDALSMSDCPTWDDVVALSEEVANIVAGRTADYALGQRYACAVRLTAGSGLRLAELLAVTKDRVDFQRGVIRVDRQLDRYVSWLPGDPMPTSSTKNGITRDARVWSKVADDLKTLLDKADDNGAIVPPFNNIGRWADAWGRLLNEAAERINWNWRPHYLRHHYGSYSIADRTDGGMGMHFTKVQQSMGHASPEVTLRTYTHTVKSSDDGWVS